MVTDRLPQRNTFRAAFGPPFWQNYQPMTRQRARRAGQTVVFAGLLVYLVYVLRQHNTPWPDLAHQLRHQPGAGWWTTLLLALMPVNQLLEACKWQVLLRAVVPVSLPTALRSVLAGLSLGLAVPAGDVAGRVLSLRGASQPADTTAGLAGAALLAGGLQYYVALLFGGLGWAGQWLALPVRRSAGGTSLLIGLIGLIIAGVGLSLTRRHWTRGLARHLTHRPRLRAWAGSLLVAADPSGTALATGFGLAVARHLVFSVQFWASLRLFGIGLEPASALAGIWVVYLTKTVAPALNLFSDLGVREVAALWAFGPFGLPAPTLLAATLSLWLVNVAVPVLAGLPGLWQLLGVKTGGWGIRVSAIRSKKRAVSTPTPTLPDPQP